jgi:hypothetical protein
MSIELEVYPFNDPTKILDIIPRRTDVRGLVELKGVGAGSFNIPSNDPKLIEQPSLLDYRNIVKQRVDGVVQNAFLIQSKKHILVSGEEAAGEEIQCAGEGIRTWFRDAIVFPYQGIKKDSFKDRVFSFASERGDWYKSDQWVEPKTRFQYLTPSQWGTAPAEWPDIPQACWLWPTERAWEPVAIGMAYFRREFTLDKAYKSAFFFAGDDEFEVYLDAQQIMKVPTGETWQKTYRVDMEVPAGDHILAVRIRNTGGPAGIIGAMSIWGDPNVPSSSYPFIYTGDAAHGGWKTLGYPESEPGWTAGEIVLTLLREAKARGVKFAELIKPTFTAARDTDGKEWDSKRPWAFPIGIEYREVLEKLEELYCDFYLDPDTFEFHAYNKRGEDLTVTASPIVLRKGVNLLQADTQGKAAIKNTLIVETDEGYIEKQDARGSVTQYGRVESKITTDLGLDLSNDVANAAFEKSALPEETATFRFNPSRDLVPFVNFKIGDWVLAPGVIEKQKRRVVSVSFGEDPASGRTLYEAEFDNIYKSRDNRIARALDSLTLGSAMTGTLANATNSVASGAGTPAFNNNATAGGGGGTTPGTPSAGSYPGIPGGVTASAFRNTDTEAQVSVSWNPVSAATDGTALTVSHYNVWSRLNRTVAERTTRNTVNNASFETGVAGISAQGCQVARDTVWARAGLYSIRLIPSSTSPESYVTLDGGPGGMRSGMAAGGTYTASAVIYLAQSMSGTLSAQARTMSISYVTSAGATVVVSSKQAPATAAETRLSVTATIPSGATAAWVTLYNGSSTTSPREVWWDAVSVFGSAVNLPYFDGANANTGYGTYSWEGEQHASPSLFVTTDTKNLIATVVGNGTTVRGLEANKKLAISVTAVSPTGNTGASSAEAAVTT